MALVSVGTTSSALCAKPEVTEDGTLKELDTVLINVISKTALGTKKFAAVLKMACSTVLTQEKSIMSKINYKTPVPKVGQILHFFDDGKAGDSRHYLAVVTHVLKPEQMKRLHWVPSDHDVYYDGNPPKDWLEIWEHNKKEYDWIFAQETDFFVGCSIPEYDDHIMWFAREKDGTWFSMDAQSCWQGGFLDVTGEKYQRMVEEGYTYSERI